MCRQQNTLGYRLLLSTTQQINDLNPLDRMSTYMQEESVNATKLNTYVADLNPSLDVHEVYTTDKYIPDFYRVSFTRLRLMSHHLRVETGRWNRTPANLRTCPCDDTSVQTEEHVLIMCPLSNNCRIRYGILDFRNIISLMNEKNHVTELCKYVHDTLRMYV